MDMFIKYFDYMLDNGVYLAPSAYEAGFISIAHTDEDIDKTINLTNNFFSENLHS